MCATSWARMPANLGSTTILSDLRGTSKFWSAYPNITGMQTSGLNREAFDDGQTMHSPDRRSILSWSGAEQLR